MRRAQGIAVTACLVAYVLIGAAVLDKPGLHPQEASFAIWALGNGADSAMPSLKAIAFWPILNALGPSYASIRLPSLLLGACALLALFLMTCRHLRFGQALLVLALCALDPFLIFSVKTDAGPVAIAFFLRMAAVMHLSVYATFKKPGALWFAAFLAGVSVWARPDSLALWIGLAAGFWWAYRGEISFKSHTARIALGLFLVGAAPAARELFGTGVQWILRPEAWPGMEIGARWRTIFGSLSGVHPFYDYFHGRLGARYTILPQTLAFLAATALVLRWKVKKPLLEDRFVVAMAAGCSLYCLLLFLAPCAIGPDAVFALAGLTTFLLVALGNTIFAAVLKTSAQRRAAWALFALPLIIIGGIACGMYTLQLEKRGGEGHWSTAINELTAFGMAHAHRPLVELDWGMAVPVRVLSAGKARMVDPDPARHFQFPKTGRPDSKTPILFARLRTEKQTSSQQETFVNALHKQARVATVLAVFANEAGHSEFIAFEVVGPGPGGAP